MKTVFRKIFILIAIILAFGLNLSYADNRSVDEIKNEIKILKNEFENSSNDIEKKEINKELSKLVDELLQKQGKLNKIYISKYSARSYDSCFNGVFYENDVCTPWYSGLNTGDIILFKSKSKNSLYLEWTHAALVYDSKNYVEASGYYTKSSKFSIYNDLVKNILNKGEVREIAIIRMGLSKTEQNTMKSYIDKNLLGKSYGIIFAGLTEDLYCSKLVWLAHKYSGKKINLDSDGGYTYPGDLLDSEYIGEVLHIYFN